MNSVILGVRNSACVVVIKDLKKEEMAVIIYFCMIISVKVAFLRDTTREEVIIFYLDSDEL